jgi:hypothetical protein
MAGVFVDVEKSRSDFHWLVATIKAAAAACVYSTITSESQTAIFLHDMIQFIKSRAPAERADYFQLDLLPHQGRSMCNVNVLHTWLHAT